MPGISGLLAASGPRNGGWGVPRPEGPARAGAPFGQTHLPRKNGCERASQGRQPGWPGPARWPGGPGQEGGQAWGQARDGRQGGQARRARPGGPGLGGGQDQGWRRASQGNFGCAECHSQTGVKWARPGAGRGARPGEPAPCRRQARGQARAARAASQGGPPAQKAGPSHQQGWAGPGSAPARRPGPPAQAAQAQARPGGRPRPPKWGGAHKSQKIVDVTINIQLETLFPGMPAISRFLAALGPPNGGEPTKARKWSISQ